MKESGFNRRRFLASIALLSVGQVLPRAAFSFSNSPAFLKALPGNDLLSYLDARGEKKPVTNLAEWEIKRRQILRGMEAAMGPLPSFLDLPEMNIQIIEETKELNYTRQNITFTVASNEIVSAYLYLPGKRPKKAKLPAMLVLHSTGALGKKIVDGQSTLANRAYAKELALRGYVVIAPDYPGFGEMKNYDFKNDRYVSGTMKSIFDNMRCVDLLQAMPETDPDRIGVIGHSLGGHNAMFTAAFDQRLQVVVSSCGWTLFDYYDPAGKGHKKSKDVLAPWAQEVYMPLLREKYDLDINKIPFDFDEVIAALAPRPFFVNAPKHDRNFNVKGVRLGMEKTSAVYEFLGAKNSLKVRYPEAAHDFPADVRQEAYQFIDKRFQHL